MKHHKIDFTDKTRVNRYGEEVVATPNGEVTCAERIAELKAENDELKAENERLNIVIQSKNASLLLRKERALDEKDHICDTNSYGICRICAQRKVMEEKEGDQ